MNQIDNVTTHLEILNIDTLERTILHSFPYMVEAPNWTPDGKWITFNHEGCMWKISVDGKNEILKIDTGFATRCNNDHLVSPDGKLLAISHRVYIEDGKPAIYILPIEGGKPKQITNKTPSYLHGWSPDGTTLTYCAERGGEYDIYTIALDGSQETRLTFSTGLNDGPEYTPDGKCIWFNSVRSGLMQLWRMKSDGSEQEQITFDTDSNAWFPHLSPDGDSAVYIVYKKGDVEPHQHLRYKNVELRIIPTRGGSPKTIAKLFGGQGSLNVNSWSPCGTQIAFMSFEAK